MTKLLTYKIVADVKGRLKAGARTACNFWNRFVQPGSSIVMRLGTFTSIGSTIARAYQPYKKAGVVYGVIEFNTNFLEEYSDFQVAGTIAHELGHTLGIGWEKWMKLFDHKTGRFKAPFTKALPALSRMLVETDYGPGTTLSHWDEEKYGDELMTGFKEGAEHVLPVTVDVAGLLGHKVIERLKRKTMLEELFAEMRSVQFLRKDEAKSLDLDYFAATPVWEETYDFGRRKRPFAAR